jgi:hypothetical protein
MDTRISRLLDAFRQVEDCPPQDLAEYLRQCPQPGALPSPWETWTLIGLVRHRGRQLWVADVIRTRLRGEPAALAARGALGHPDGVRQSGSVPGLPEWEYYFHGRGCCLTHKVSGEDVDVDFWDASAEYSTRTSTRITSNRSAIPNPPSSASASSTGLSDRSGSPSTT